MSDGAHVLDVTETRYGLAHPRACRPALLDCPVERAARALTTARAAVGRYEVDVDDFGDLMVLQPVGAVPIDVLDEVAAERARQHAKWGEQNHPDGTGGDWEASKGWGVGEAQWHAENATRRTDEAAMRGDSTWALILDEEVAEAFAETDATRLRAELVQVAAVATQWVEAIDRRATS